MIQAQGKIHRINAGLWDEIFTWNGPDGVLHFNATRAYLWALRGGEGVSRVIANVSADQIEQIRRERGIEQRKLDRLCEPWLSMPIVAVQMPGGTVLTIDGHHRLVKRGPGEFRFLLIAEPYWKQFLVELPECLA